MTPRRWIAAAATFLLAASAAADVDVSTQLGFGGRWISDAATPLTVSLTNTGGDTVRVQLSVSQGERRGRDDQVQVRAVPLAAGITRVETFLVPGTLQWRGRVSVEVWVSPTVPIHSRADTGDRGSLTVDVTGPDASDSGNVPYASVVLGVLGDARGVVASRTKLDGGGNSRSGDEASTSLAVLPVDPSVLRLAPIGLDGFDALLAVDPDDRLGATPDERDGLLDWVALGGRLVVSLGEHAPQFANSPLAADMPATWTGAGHTSYGSLLDELGCDAGPEMFRGPWIGLSPASTADSTRTDAGGRVLSVERRVGMGRIVVLAYDLRKMLELATLDEKAVRTLIEPAVFVPKPEPMDPNQYMGVDVSSAIGRILQIGAFKPPPLALVVLGILLYVVVVGPLDWFVLKRLKKERLTTLTFAGTVAGFTLLAYGSSLLLFSSGARVNRIVFADLADAGRDGRQVLRFQDIAGYYSPMGSDQEVVYPLPAAMMTSSLPGMDDSGQMGSAMPVIIGSPDPLHLRTVVQLAFRSQRVVRGFCAGTLGPSVDVEWSEKGGESGVVVTNGLPVDLDLVLVFPNANQAYIVGPLASGAKSDLVTSRSPRGADFAGVEGRFSGGMFGRNTTPGEVDVKKLLESMTLAESAVRRDRPHLSRDELAALAKSGIDRTASLSAGRGLLVAFARSFPVPLPGSSTTGDTYVVLRKEVRLR